MVFLVVNCLRRINVSNGDFLDMEYLRNDTCSVTNLKEFRFKLHNEENGAA